MSQYILARLIWIPFLLISVAFITFILGRFGPGDPVEIMMGTKYDPVVAAVSYTHLRAHETDS